MNQFDYDFLKTAKLPSAWPKGLLIFVFILCLSFAAAGFGLNYWNKIQNNELEDLNKKFQTLRNSFPAHQEQEIALFEKKLASLQTILNNHVYFSNILAVLEKLTAPQVYYTNLEYNLEKNSLLLTGTAKNQQVLSEAVNGFVNNPRDIKMVIVKDARTVDNNNIRFNLEIIFNSEVPQYKSLP